MSENRKEAEATRDRLAELVGAALDGGTSEVLAPGRRRAILDAAGRSRRPFWTPILPLDARWVTAAAAAVLALTLIPVAFQDGGTPLQGPGEALVAPVSTNRIDVRREGGAVVLSWEDGDSGRYRVIRGTNPRDLSSTDEVMDGNTWTDPQQNGSPIVFYRVEELEG